MEVCQEAVRGSKVSLIDFDCEDRQDNRIHDYIELDPLEGYRREAAACDRLAGYRKANPKINYSAALDYAHEQGQLMGIDLQKGIPHDERQL